MGQSYVQLAADSTGKKIDTQVTATSAQHRQTMTIGDPSVDAQVAAVTSGNALKTDASATTQPVSAASLPLPSGASTAAKQPALGTAGSASADVITVQGVASMTALKVDGSGVTQPVSGTVTANAGTNLNTSALALESGGNLASTATNTTGLNNTVGTAGSAIPSKGVVVQGSDYGGTAKAQTLKVDSSGNAQVAVTNTPTVTANAGTNLNTSLLALESGGNLATIVTDLGTLDTDVKSNITLHAGTNIIGKVGIDQTTPGTTNGVQVNAALPAGTNAIGSVGSNSATGSAVPANGFYDGLQARTSLPTAGTNGNLVGAMADKFGRAVVHPNGMRDLVLPMTQLTLTSTTTETSLIAATASVFNDILSLVVINTSATATQVDFRDSTGGTIRLSLYIPAGDTRGISLTNPMPQNAVNTAWTAKCGTSVASVIITGTYLTNA